MKSFLSLLLIITALSHVLGCNSVYFYETEKVSFTIEGRPDPTAPVAANLGLKQRVVLIAPASAETGTNQATGDALSVLSSFRFQIHAKEPRQPFSRMTIDSALITGRPAQSLLPKETANAMSALTGGEVQPIISYDISVLRMMFQGVKQLQATLPADSDYQDQIKALTGNLNALDGLAPQKYDALIFCTIENGNFIARSNRDVSDTIPGEPGFDRVLTYWHDLDMSVKALAKVRDGDPATHSEVDRLAAGRKHEEVKKVKDAFEARLRRSSALTDLRNFWSQIGG